MKVSPLFIKRSFKRLNVCPHWPPSRDNLEGKQYLFVFFFRFYCFAVYLPHFPILYIISEKPLPLSATSLSGEPSHQGDPV